MADFAICALDLGKGRIALCPMPGRTGNYAGDLAAVIDWGPALVLTMATTEELAREGADGLGADLAQQGIGWRHLPVADFEAESFALSERWAEASGEAHEILANGGRVLAHCKGGCGRSGMAVMRLMVEAGETADRALARLRDVRPCAVETEEQRRWATRPISDRLGR